MKTHAFPATCPGCSTELLVSEYDYAEHVGVGLMRADPTSITPDIETACIIIGRPTYNLHTRHRIDQPCEAHREETP